MNNPFLGLSLAFIPSILLMIDNVAVNCFKKEVTDELFTPSFYINNTMSQTANPKTVRTNLPSLGLSSDITLVYTAF